MRSMRSGGVAAPFSAWGVRLGGVGLRLVSVSDQFPQVIQSFARDCRDRQHGIIKNGFKFSERADPLAARSSLSILVATIAQFGATSCSHLQAATSFVSPGCLASTSRSALSIAVCGRGSSSHPAAPARKMARVNSSEPARALPARTMHSGKSMTSNGGNEPRTTR